MHNDEDNEIILKYYGKDSLYKKGGFLNHSKDKRWFNSDDYFGSEDEDIVQELLK